MAFIHFQKESHILAAKTKADIEKLDPYFNVNNKYLGMFKQDEGAKDNSESVKFQVSDCLGMIYECSILWTSLGSWSTISVRSARRTKDSVSISSIARSRL